MLPEQIALRYIDTWNDLDPRHRRAAIDALFAEECVYTDPLAAVRGRDGVDGFIGAAQKQLAGMKFSLAGKVDAHHDQVRFTWHATPDGATEPVAIGFDVVLLEGARIRAVYGFLDKAPG